MTFGNLRTLVKQALGNRTSGLLTNAWYGDRLNSGYRRIATFQGLVTRPGRTQPQFRILRFFELEDRQARSLTTALTDNFVTPVGNAGLGDVYVVQEVYDRTGNRPLRRASRREILRLDPDGTGRPLRWYPAGKNGVSGYYIDRRPAVAADNLDVYEFTYHYPKAIATDGSGDSTEPVIPDDWHEPIWYAAVIEGARLIDMPEKATEFEERFLTFIAERKSPHEEASYSGIATHSRNVRVGPVYSR